MADQQSELDALRAFSAHIGADPLLTQGAGGNTSIKDGDTLWIKASGTWLAHALERDIMVPVEMTPLLDAVRSSDPRADRAQEFTIEALNSAGLRPSIETTVHALMPQQVVAHVHCVDTISFAVRTDANIILRERLEGLNWALVPYARPGLPLALAIDAVMGPRPDVLILANHGLVVAADTVAETEKLLDEVKHRLAVTPRATGAADESGLAAAIGDTSYRLPADPLTHAAAFDNVALNFAEGGSMYPDHVIFLGAGSPVAEDGEDAAAVIRRLGFEPAFIIFPGRGVVLRADMTAGADAMARCLADVTTRIAPGAPVRFLSLAEHEQLTNWDAEKYRQMLNRKEQPA